MAGTVKQLIDELMLLRTRKRAGSQHFVRAHLVLNGIDPDEYHDHSPDNPEAIVSLKKMIADFKKTL